MDLEKKKKIRFHTMAVILIIIFCAAITPVTLQNDTFYTIKIGEYILENGITMQEPFAWHENLEYTFPHWAYDVLTYLVYSIGGMTGVYVATIVLASILGISIYFVSNKLVKNKLIAFILTISTLYLLKPYICARAQLVTFILFIFTIYFIEKFLETKKIRYAIGLIIIPFLIANLHLATFYFYFILYLPYIAEYVCFVLAYSAVIISGSVVENIKKEIAKQGETEELRAKLEKAEAKYNRLKKKQDNRIENPYKIRMKYSANIKWLLVIFVITLLTGFLTPLGTTPYTYLIKTMQGISTKNISEHLPTVLAQSKELLVVLVIYLCALTFTKVKIRLSDLFMLAGLTLLALFTRRQASMLFLIGAVILGRVVKDIACIYCENFLQKFEDKASSILGITVISALVIIFSIFQYKPKINSKYVDENSYPVQAADWINENLDVSKMKLYNEYNFGSYLIYKNIPVFVDSRCDLYMPEFNENVFVFSDFLNISSMNFKNVEEKIEKYGFTHFITSSGSRFKLYLDDHPEKYKAIYPTGDIVDKNFTIYERIK